MTENLASRAITTLAAVQAMGESVDNSHPMRHQVRLLKRIAEDDLWHALGSAYNLSLAAEQVISDYDKTLEGAKA